MAGYTAPNSEHVSSVPGPGSPPSFDVAPLTGDFTTLIPSAGSPATSSATLNLSAQTAIPFDSVAATSTPTLATSAQTTVPFASSSGLTTAVLELTPRWISLASTATSVPTLTLSATTTIPFDAIASISVTALSLRAQTVIPLNSSSGVTTPSLNVSAITTIALQTSTALAGSTLALTATTQIPSQTSSGVTSPSLTLTAQTAIPLNSSPAVSTGVLELTPRWISVSSAAISTTTLTLSAQTTLSTSNYSTTILGESSLVSYWRLGELSGTTATDSKAAHNGTYSGSLSLAQPGALTGDNDSSVLFSGGTAATTYNPFATGAVQTFEGWLYRNSQGTFDTVFGSTSGNQPILRCQSGSTTMLFTPDLALVVGVSWLNAVTLSSWLHWVLIFDDPNNTVELYINGVSKGVKAMAGVYNASPGNIIFGAQHVGDPFDGYLDEIAVYNAALSPAQITAHYVAGTTSAVFQSAAILALTAKTTIALSSAAGQSSTTLSVSATTNIPLGTAAATATPTLSLSATTFVPSQSSVAVSSTTFALSPIVPLQTSAAVSSTTLAVKAQTTIPLGSSAGLAFPTLALFDTTTVLLNGSSAVSSAVLAFTPVYLPIGSASSITTTALAVSARSLITLTSAGQSSTSLALKAPTQIVFARITLNTAPWPATSFWNRKLPSNATLDTNSSAIVSDLVTQVGGTPTSTTYVNEGTGPIYVVNSNTPTQSMRWASYADPTLAAAMPTTQLPQNFAVGPDTDEHASTYNTETGEYQEYWKLTNALMAPGTTGYATASQCTFTSGGSLPAGNVYYPIVPYGGDVTAGYGDIAYAGANPVQAVSLNQKATFTWGTSDGATGYDIYRSHSNIAGGAYQYIASVGPSVHTYTDTGTASSGNPSYPTAVMSTPGAEYGGYMADARLSTGRFESPHPAWGATASSLPLMGGAILLSEALAKYIPHALAMAIPSCAPGVVWPAQRTDGIVTGTHPQEAHCFRFPASLDTSGITNPFTRAVMNAIRDYGMYLRDKSGTIAPFIEGPLDNSGITDPINQLYGGHQRWEVMATQFPWASLQVVDSAYLQALAASPLDPFITTGTQTGFASSVSVSSATLALSAKTTISLNAIGGLTVGTLRATAATKISLGTCSSTTTTTLSLFIPFYVILNSSISISTADLTVTYRSVGWPIRGPTNTDVAAQTNNYVGTLIFETVTDSPNSITYPEVSIPLYIQQLGIPVRQPKITQVNTISNADPSSGYDTALSMIFYGANEPLQVELSGYLITPLNSSGQCDPTADGTKSGYNLGLPGISYADLIEAYLEGRMNVSSTGRWIRTDPSFYIDPYGRQYNNVVLGIWECNYSPVAKKQTFSMTLYLSPLG